MRDNDKTKKRLLNELEALHLRVRELEKLEGKYGQAEETVKRSDEFSKTVLDNTTDAISLINVHDFRIVGVNSAFLKQFDLKKEGVIGKTCYEITHHRSKPCIAPDDVCPLWETVTSGEHSMAEHVHYRADGEKLYIEVSTFPVKDKKRRVTQVVHMSREITGRKRMQAALRKSEERHRAIIEQAAESIVLVDAETGELVEFNNMTHENLGYSREEFTKLKIPDFEVIESAEEVIKHIEKIIKECSDLFETKHRTKNGEIRNIQVSSRAIYIGGKTYIQSIWLDITERKQVEETLKESEERYRDLYDNAPNAYFSVGADGLIRRCNRRATELLGYEVKELVGQPVFNLYANTPQGEEKAAKVFQQFKAGEQVIDEELQMQKGDGTPIWVRLTVNTIRDARGQVLESRSMVVDITERKKMEEQLQHSQLLASLGKMTAGIAHEVNNPLGSILLYSELLMASDVSHQTKKDLRVIHDEARRATKTMTDLLTYSRGMKLQMRRLNLHKILKKVLAMRRYQERMKNIITATNLLNGRLYVKGDSSQLTQVFMNLMLNAEEAVRESKGSNIVITTQVDGEWVKVSIADDGTGISEENLSQVFYPFFSTKEVGEGTGLGLSTCYGIVTSHGGLIRAENNEMGGATFTIELPLVEIQGQGRLPRERKKTRAAVT